MIEVALYRSLRVETGGSLDESKEVGEEASLKNAETLLDLTGNWKMRAEYKDIDIANAERVRKLDQEIREDIQVTTVGDRCKKKIWLSENGFLDAVLPGDVTDILAQQGVVEEPLEGCAPAVESIVPDVAWWFFRIFEVSAELMESDEIILFLELVDYHAEILVNGIPCIQHDTVYRPICSDIKEYLTEGTNEIIIRLTDGAEGVHVMSRQSWFTAMDYCDNDTRFFLRKPQYVYGWDWCPPTPTCGIGGRMELIGRSGAYVNTYQLRTIEAREDGSGLAQLCLEIDKTMEEAAEESILSISICSRETGESLFECTENLYLAGGKNYYERMFSFEHARYWWPNGCGKASLYEVRVSINCRNYRSEFYDKYAGLRRITIDQSKIDADSRHFDVLVNGKKVFCRGGNWVPPDSLYLRTAKRKYKELIEEAARCNFNMLRIWGGGLYETDHFYQLCAENGIMLLHDFMYSCAFYPDDEAFCQEAREEANYQTRRLAHFPCMAMWSGGNEIHESLTDWFGRRPPRFWGKRIHNEILPEVVHQNTPFLFYMPSSPYFGCPTKRVMDGEYPNISAEPDTGKYANSALAGDTHAWNYLRRDHVNRFRYFFEPEAFDRFPARFSSEFGIHGPMMPESMKKALGLQTVEQFAFDLPTWRYHGEQDWKREYILDMIQNHAISSKNLTPGEYLFYGGIVQGMTYQEMAEAVRCKEYGSGMLIWMYNDCWPETGWSVIDYYLTRKYSFYFLKRAFAPRKLLIREIDDGVRVWVLNESAEHAELELVIGRYRLAGREAVNNHIVDERRYTASVAAHGRWSVTIDTVANEDGFWFVRCENDSSFEAAISLRSNWRKHNFQQEKRIERHENTGMYCQNSEIESLVRKEGEDLVLSLKGSCFVPMVILKCEKEATRLSDNCFSLLPGETRQVRVYHTTKSPRIVSVKFEPFTSDSDRKMIQYD